MQSDEHDDHYSELYLMDYLNGRIPETELTKVEEHLQICPDCRVRLNVCRTMHTLLGDKTVSEPPKEWVQEGVSLFDPKLFDQKPQYVFGMLTADSLVATNPELRSTASEERHLHFESSGYAVSVSLETSSSVLKGIVGQVSRKGTGGGDQKDVAGGDLKVVAAEVHVNSKVYRSEVTPFGEFLFRLDEPLDGNPIELRFAMKEEPCLALLIPC